jgi:hypothetical protein
MLMRKVLFGQVLRYQNNNLTELFTNGIGNRGLMKVSIPLEIDIKQPSGLQDESMKR